MGIHCVTSRLNFMNRRSPLFYSLSILFFFFFFFFFFLLVFLNTSPSTKSCLVFRCQMAVKADFLSQVRRRILYRLGSLPPRCNWKCGVCMPCKPVHVAVPPGTPVTSEYYPEAWRCKCGDKLYMP